MLFYPDAQNVYVYPDAQNIYVQSPGLMMSYKSMSTGVVFVVSVVIWRDVPSPRPRVFAIPLIVLIHLAVPVVRVIHRPHIHSSPFLHLFRDIATRSHRCARGYYQCLSRKPQPGTHDCTPSTSRNSYQAYTNPHSSLYCVCRYSSSSFSRISPYRPFSANICSPLAPRRSRNIRQCCGSSRDIGAGRSSCGSRCCCWMTASWGSMMRPGCSG